MIVEFHAIQNLAPSNINRDDTGSPKDVIFGGTRRARVSSQSWKRAMRDAFMQDELLGKQRLGVRTKRIVKELRERLLVTHPDAKEQVEAVTIRVLEATGFKIILPKEGAEDQEPKTQYLFFIGRDQLDELAKLIDANWDTLTSTKKADVDRALKALRGAIMQSLDGRRAADLGLFGRMLANLPEKNVDGATQFAHAISTHTVETEFDYYTAVDDLKPDDNSGADMIGYVEFVAPTLYRYASVDVAQLSGNLGRDPELVRNTLRAFARAFVETLPGGKKTSMDTSTSPALTVAVIRDKGRWSLANAFVEPVDRIRGRDRSRNLVRLSIEELNSEWADMKGLYGEDQQFETPYIVSTRYADAVSSFGQPQSGIGEWLKAIDDAVTIEEGSPQ